MSSNTDVSVLVVDDNAATRYATSHVLRSVGYQVVTASSGSEALDIAWQAPPDLIVLDINLPDIDGFQVCRELRARPETRRTPITYLSATFVDDADKIIGVDAGADGYLTHPVEAPVLIATVRALLRARRAEEAVQRSEARFKAIFECAMNGIALLTDELVFLDVNPAMSAMLARDREAIVGRHLSVFSLKERQLDIEAMTTALDSAGQWRGTAPLLSASGGHVELEWHVSRDTGGDARLAIVSDVTQRLAAEAERERLLVREQLARGEAEQANRLKDDFLAALSHELRTPLNAIVGFSRLLQRSPLLADDADTLGWVNAIERNAWVQARLISDLLDVSRITSGKLELDRQRLSAADAVDSALASIQSSARLKRVTIHAHLDRSVESIWWDPSRFQQVIWNLVDNAVKFSATGGVVDVRLEQTDTAVEFRVSDNGQGISPEFLPHVFERFRQEQSPARRGYGGLGLGLAIVHQLVAAHGGSITVSSEGEGHGATFLVRLPRTFGAPEVPRGVAQSVAAVDLSGHRILIVEDNDDARTLLAAVLNEVNAEIRAAASVTAALEILDVFEPELLISDLAMPERDGFDLIRAVREAGWTPARLPAVALSAFASEQDRLRALSAGYQLHFGKPPDLTALMIQLARLLARPSGS
jgi:PAS domain S-box-containing protein